MKIKNLLRKIFKEELVSIFKGINFNILNIPKTLMLVDRVTVGIILLLIGIGSLELLSSLQVLEWRMCKELFFFKKHLIFLSIFFLGVLFIGQQTFEINIFLGGIVGLLSFCCCCVVLLFGPKINGSSRWLNLFGFSLQPSVFLKNTLSIFAPFLCRNLKSHGLLIGLCAVVVILEPDVGMTILICAIGFTQIFILYEDVFKHLWVIGVGCVFSLFFLFFKGNYLILRVSKFFSNGGLYQSNIALNNMRKTYLLFGRSEATPIPDSHCDFIFASITSHYGLFIGIFIIFLFLLFFVRNIQKALTLPTHQKIVVFGILAQISYQSIFHLASNLSFVPPKGVSLPFVSFGGSELISSMISVGTLLGLTSKKI